MTKITPELTLENLTLYDMKEYKRYKIYNCKYDYFDLTKRCDQYNENCERLYAKIDKDPEISGPFEFIFDKTKFNNENNEEKEDKEYYYDKATKEVLNEENIDEVLIEYALKCKQ
ncbi:hypothetical protein F8M41_022631 [Gigaspora margarita]|uniref:Uncharacterized protein n=1 Tax=Gigaspora margarita TaxID=4874 RepID=A0A8H4AER3_GIGMA|nr:hypothetical protein F8M41_022631 [Gigaspora margarita]